MDIDYSKIVSQLEQWKCQEHGLSAKISHDGSGLKVSACCDDFSAFISQKVSELAYDQTSQKIKDLFGN